MLDILKRRIPSTSFNHGTEPTRIACMHACTSDEASERLCPPSMHSFLPSFCVSRLKGPCQGPVFEFAWPLIPGSMRLHKADLVLDV